MKPTIAILILLSTLLLNACGKDGLPTEKAVPIPSPIPLPQVSAPHSTPEVIHTIGV